MELKGKVALITGASAPNGIGRAAARRLAAVGARVVITDQAGSLSLPEGRVERMDLLDGLAQAIHAEGGMAEVMELDVTDQEQIGEITGLIRDRFGGVDILVNNAGSTIGTGPFLQSIPAQWETSFQVNLLGPTLLCQAVIPHMQARGGGAIVNIGSIGSLGAEAGFGAYTAMKHGLVGLTKTLAAEFGPDGIRCNLVCPGYIATDMHEGANRRIARERGMSVEDVRIERYAAVAQRRAGSPEEVAEVIAFLAGPASSYINGASLPVSGGTPAGL